MSQINEISPKHCANKQTSINLHKLNNKLFLKFLYLSILLILFLIFLVWLILHPKKPQFSLKQAVVNQLNLSATSRLDSSIQLTLQSNNPNKKVGIYYDEFSLYASYNDERITPDTPVPPFYQEHEETNSISASLAGIGQPVGPSFLYEVQRDRGIGRLALSFKVMGRLRWKVGTWVSGRHRFFVNCVSVMPLGPIPSPPLSSRQGSKCSTTV